MKLLLFLFEVMPMKGVFFALQLSKNQVTQKMPEWLAGLIRAFAVTGKYILMGKNWGIFSNLVCIQKNQVTRGIFLLK